MNLSTFYRKYANLPIPRRAHPYTAIRNGTGTVYTLYELYKWIDEQNTKRREAEVELKRLLDIAEKMLH